MTLRPPHTAETARSPRGFVAATLLLVTALSSTAQAQTIQNSGANQTQVRLGFIGTVSNSVLITVVGMGTTTFNSGSSATMPAHAQGTINFGTFSTLLQPPPTNGAAFRVALPAPGAVVVATLDALIDYNGSVTASITVGRRSAAGAAPDVPLANLRVASPALGAWTSGNQGAQVPDFGQPGYDLCTARGDATCISAKSYVHDLGIYLPDTQAAGPFSTVILYTGTVP
jgi:hypothetical protein